MLHIWYQCPDCDHCWEEDYECACDSECPECECESITPLRWDDLIPASQVRDLIARILAYPHAHICKHWAAELALDVLERNGSDVSDELAQAVVNADDPTAILLLQNSED